MVNCVRGSLMLTLMHSPTGALEPADRLTAFCGLCFTVAVLVTAVVAVAVVVVALSVVVVSLRMIPC